MGLGLLDKFVGEKMLLATTAASLLQVRDMTGDGQVLKKRIKEGTGDFPVDCPLHDTRIRCHYRVRQLTNPTNSGPWVFDTTHQGTSPGHSGSNTEGNPHTTPIDKSSTSSNSTGTDVDSWPELGSDVDGAAVRAVEADTGCGELPDGLEMCLKLMVPNEVASVICQPKYAYQVGRQSFLWNRNYYLFTKLVSV